MLIANLMCIVKKEKNNKNNQCMHHVQKKQAQNIMKVKHVGIKDKKYTINRQHLAIHC